MSSPPASAKSVVTQWSFAASSSQTSCRNGSRACCLTARLHVLPERVVVAVGARDADDREARRQEPADGERVERRHDLLVRQVARRAEDDERAGIGRPPQREAVGERVLLLRGLFDRLGHCLRALLEMAAEGLAHRGEDAVAEVGLAARGEPVEERGGEHRHRHALLDRGLHRPPALARVAHVAGVLVEARRLVQRLRAVRSRSHEEMTEPRRQSSADRGDVELVLVEVGVAQRRRLGVRLLRVQADVRVLEDVEALGVRLHQAVLDAVVDHLHEVAGAGRAAVQPALLLGRASPLRPGRSDGGVDAGRERLEHRLEPLDGLVVAADHQAVAALACPRRRR